MKENQNIEFKQSWRDEYLQYVCGFANAQGGTLYIGIDDKGKVRGIDNASKLLENLPNQINQTMGLLAQVDLHTEGGKEYISIHVEPSDQAISYRGKFYFRSGSTLQEINGVALTDFLFRKNNTTWDQSFVEEATLDDIDAESVGYFVRKAVEAQRLDANAKELPVITLLRKLKLVNQDDRLTMAALLLFGKDIERWNLMASFRIGRFQQSQANLLFQDNIVCPLIHMPERVLWTLRSRYLIAPIHYEGLQRVEPLEIPEDALREMVCNAIVHKNYLGPHIQMRVWDDKIELWNYGELPYNYTIEKLLQTHESYPRNPLIAQIFYLAGFIEQWGRGYEKIHDAFVREHLTQPAFEQVRGGFLAIIPREKFIAINTGKPVGTEVSTTPDNQTTERSGQTGGQTGGQTIEKVFGLIKENPKITRAQISHILGISSSAIQKHIDTLKKSRIRRVGGDFGGHWEILS
ncbi:MAG: putative DNA binding domain-containing protein [Paludibacteraceae bacterium]|nr:putative DNA binding domain-containing protein [Paludibacteraceae bacterium]